MSSLFARSEDKLKIALDNGADHGINVRDKITDAVRSELEKLTGRIGIGRSHRMRRFRGIDPAGVLTAGDRGCGGVGRPDR